ncbi:MAG: DUF1800 domain-containing protein [Bacteroidetes bacterium]|nr:MAG: DUF1800 domain-containing protein [Bacteroidota bacterium]
MAGFTTTSGSQTVALPSDKPIVNDSLDPYVPIPTKPWNARRVAHLYRRLGFGASIDQIEQGLQMDPSDLVDQLLDAAASLPPPTPPSWADWTSDDYTGNNALITQHRRDLRDRWFTEMLDEGVRAKMAFFWSNHFVTELEVYGCNAYLWSYYALLNAYALGNFREFVKEMGKNPAMLVYLNGAVNEVGEPNENYARELMELFTMGEGNGYTQLDVVEMSRAVTGWKAFFNGCYPPYFDPAKFDNNPKTIFGVTANFSFDEAHDLIFSERPDQVAHFITGKIYRNFVYETIDDSIVDGLATTFKDNNWELLPVLKQLFKSEHFFEERFMNTLFKSPVEALIPVFKMANANSVTHIDPGWWSDIAFYLDRLGQIIFGPPNVAGWPGYRSWVNENTLALRWNYVALVATYVQQNDQLRDNLRTLAKTVSDNSNDATVVTQALVDFFIGQDLDTIYADAAVGYFKAGIPEGYFTDGSWNLNWDEVPDQVINLLKYIARLPEFQLA